MCPLAAEPGESILPRSPALSGQRLLQDRGSPWVPAASHAQISGVHKLPSPWEKIGRLQKNPSLNQTNKQTKMLGGGGLFSVVTCGSRR